MDKIMQSLQFSKSETFSLVCSYVTVCILLPESQFAMSLFMCPYPEFVNMSKNKWWPLTLCARLCPCACVCVSFRQRERENMCESVWMSVMMCFFPLILTDPVSTVPDRETHCWSLWPAACVIFHNTIHTNVKSFFFPWVFPMEIINSEYLHSKFLSWTVLFIIIYILEVLCILWNF